jgi:hypothetical protein
MPNLKLALILAAAICFGLAAIGMNAPRGNLTAAGLFFWVLSALF